MITLPWNELFYFKQLREEHPDPEAFPMHAHENFEILLFISGDITYWVEGTPYRPQPKDILLFNIAETHKVVVNSDKPYERTVIQMNKNLFSEIDPEHKLFYPFVSRRLGDSNLITSSDFNDSFWEACISRLSFKAKDRRLQVLSNFLPFLNELGTAYENSQSRSKNYGHQLSSKIVNYINENIRSELSPEKIADEFFISRSKLYNIFRETTGSGVWEYITVKRLLLAKEMLTRGEKPVNVYLNCGFNDYTTFFRAYKNKFGTSPKEDMPKP